MKTKSSSSSRSAEREKKGCSDDQVVLLYLGIANETKGGITKGRITIIFG